MSFFEFPYTRTYSSDLGWLIRHVKWLTDEVENKTIKYADPINWDITKQYEKNTVVLDGTVAYLSKEAVPSGVSINNTDYWQPIFDIAPLVEDIGNIRDQISAHYEPTVTSQHHYDYGDWLFMDDANGKPLLYVVTSEINVNDGLVVGYNIDKVTVEDMVKAVLSRLVTLEGNVGNLANLATSDKSSIVNAINEVVASVVAVNNSITNIIAELDRYNDRIANVLDYGAIGDDSTDCTDAFNAAIDDILANNKDVLLMPPGIYRISESLHIIDRGSVRICGYGNGMSQIHVVDPLLTASEPLFKIDANHSIDHVEIDHFDIMGLQDAATRFTIFDVDNTKNLNIHDLYFRGCYIFADFGSANSLGGIWTIVRDVIGSLTRYFAWINGGYNGISLIDCQINSEISYTGSTAVRIVGATIDTLYVTDCLFQRFDYGMSVRADTGNVIQNFFIDNSIFDGCGTQAITLNALGGDVARAFFNNCYINAKNASGFVLGAGSSTGRISDIKISDCNFSECGQSGILINNAIVHDVLIIGNDLTGYNKDAGGTYPGISVASGCKEFMILNNVIGNTPSSPSYAKMGIKIYSNCDNFIIAGNDVHDNTSESINCEAVGNSKSCFIYGNNGYNNNQKCEAMTPPASLTTFVHSDPRKATYYVTSGSLTNIVLNNTALGSGTRIWHCNPGDAFILNYSAAITMAVQYD